MDDVDGLEGLGGWGFCRSMRRCSPALRMLLPDPTAQPSTPNEPMNFRVHLPPEAGAGCVRFRGISADERVLVMKFLKVDSTGRFPPEAVVIRPSGSTSRTWLFQDPSKYIFTARSRFPADASSRLRITCGERSSSRMASSCSGNVSVLVEAGGLWGLGRSEDIGLGGVISEMEAVDMWVSSSRSSLKKRRFFGMGTAEESIAESESSEVR